MTRRKMYVPIMNRNEKKILIKLFKNGYIVENEPFCRNDDSDAHKAFFQSVVDGYVPRNWNVKYVSKERKSSSKAILRKPTYLLHLDSMEKQIRCNPRCMS